MRSERFFKHDLLPFAEVRSSRGSSAPFKAHMHRSVCIGAVDQGEVVYCVGGRKSVLGPGSLALINPETLHTCNPVTDKGRSYYMLYLDPEWCCRVQQSMWEVDAYVEMEKIRIDDKQLYELFCKTMEKLMDERVHAQEKEQMLFEVVDSVFMLACRPLEIKNTPVDTIEKLRKHLSTDLHRDLTLSLLARELDSNPYTLLRSFKAVTGITPHAYRMNCRIERAKEFLRQGRDITDTALECGFFDQSHFHHHFKALTTITPLQYRVNFIQ